MNREFFSEAVALLRLTLCRAGSDKDGWELLYAAKEFAKGNQCIGYRGPDADDRLRADIEAYLCIVTSNRAAA